MKEQIAAKLHGISNLDDRLLLKNVLNDVFWNLHEHSEAMYQQLEQRVFAEMAGLPSSYDIYTTIVSRKDIDPVHYFLRPMRAEDVAEQEYDLATIVNTAACNKQYPLINVFFNCDYRLLAQIFAANRNFSGTIITDQGSIATTFTVRQDLSYLDQIKQLYETFINNNIPWKTVNHPYIFRFADVILQTYERLPNPEEVVKEIKVDFAEFGQFVLYDMVPLWNVETIQLKGTGFPMPCQDKIYYEHTVSLDGIGAEHGYLAAFQTETISYIRRTLHALHIVAPIQHTDTWDIIRIINPAAGKSEQHEYPLLSNARRQDFSDIMAQKSQRSIRTEAELRRLIGSFVACDCLRLSRLEITPRSQEAENGTSYEMNFFILDEVRRADYHNRLILYFTTTDKNNFLCCDLVSFIVSEVQIHYPEYKCEGVIL